MEKKKNINEIIKNKKAFFEYEILERFEAGIALKGTEIKSIRMHNVNIVDSYATFKAMELYIINLNISTYNFGNINNHEPMRSRKLLMHKKELKKLYGKVREQGLTLIPLSIYFSGNKVKVELGLGRGKKKYDKRQSIKEKTLDREAERYIRR